MTEKKEFPNHEEPSESIDPNFTAEAVADLANKLHDAWVEENKQKNTSLETQVWNLAANVFLNQAIILQLQEAFQVKNVNFEQALATITQAAKTVDQLKVTNAVQMHAISKRLEGLES